MPDSQQDTKIRYTSCMAVFVVILMFTGWGMQRFDSPIGEASSLIGESKRKEGASKIEISELERVVLDLGVGDGAVAV